MSGTVHIPNFIRDASSAVATPFWNLKNSFFEPCELNEGEGDPALLRAQYTIDALTRDNEHLRTLLGREEDVLTLGASVLHSGNTAPYDIFTVDLGAQDGVREGMLVTIPDNLAIGYIESAHKKTSTASLFSAPNHTFIGVFSGTTTTHVEITGHGGGTMQATVPRDVDVAVGDTVTLPTFKTYVIGIVASIEVSPEDAFKTVFIRTPKNINTVRFVRIDTVHTWSTTFSEPLEEVESET